MINGLLSSCTSSRGAKYCNSRICLSAHICQEVKRPNFMKFSVVCYRGCGLILLWQQFVDDVMFSHNRPLWRIMGHYGTWRWHYHRWRRVEESSQSFQRIRQSAPHCLTLLSYIMAATCEPGQVWCLRLSCYHCIVTLSSLHDAHATSVRCGKCFLVTRSLQLLSWFLKLLDMFRRKWCWSVAKILQVVCGFLHERPSF